MSYSQGASQILFNPHHTLEPMTDQTHIGYVCFNDSSIYHNRMYGSLELLDSKKGRKLLANQLQVPGLELSMQDELLAFSIVEFQDSVFRLVTLYQHSKESPYEAVALALQDHWADPQQILRELRCLAEMQHLGAEASPFSPYLETYRAPMGQPLESSDLFIPLTLGHREEQETLLQGWISELSHDFRTVWASASAEVRATFKRNKTSIRLRNPYWRWETQPGQGNGTDNIGCIVFEQEEAPTQPVAIEYPAAQWALPTQGTSLTSSYWEVMKSAGIREWMSVALLGLAVGLLAWMIQ